LTFKICKFDAVFPRANPKNIFPKGPLNELGISVVREGAVAASTSDLIRGPGWEKEVRQWQLNIRGPGWEKWAGFE
jgi:hypothetical protein